MTCIDVSLEGHADAVRIVVMRLINRWGEFMAERPALVRQWILLRQLCSHRYGLTVKEMATEMNIGEKTIRRDLETFIEAGFPIEERVEQFGRKKWHVEPSKAQPGLSFAFDEAIALYLGRRFLDPLAGTLFWDAAQRAFQKIRASLGPAALKYVAAFSSMFHQTMVGAHDYSKKCDIIDALLRGIEERHTVILVYQSLQATEPVTYDVDPYGLAYHRGALYLVGRCKQYAEIRHWKVDRIDDATFSEMQFNWPPDFDLHEHLRRSFGVFHGDGDVRVRVQFSSTVARYVQESSWHESQKLSCRKDGSLLAEFRLSNTEEIKRWLMSFGRHAVVLEPGSLRQEIVDELSSLVRGYLMEEDRAPPRAPDGGQAGRETFLADRSKRVVRRTRER